ncbi:AAA-ATPase Vps4-associated protein 1-domain-containing protein [Xylariaceae sp. FL1272]|nr:AAA-ATPase Vps4-associated protein 1-domain-containing protein [Xylariaceae sp. FL1272]
MSLPNIWHHRKVADTSAKGCEICYKPSTSVLVTPDKQDFFYVCPSHLKDRGFASPIVDHEAIAARKKKEMDEEIAKVKKEYEEKQRKKNEKEKEKDKDKDKANKDGKEDDDKKDDKAAKKDGDTPEDKEKAKAESNAQRNTEEEPRVFALQRSVASLDLRAFARHFINNGSTKEGKPTSQSETGSGSATLPSSLLFPKIFLESVHYGTSAPKKASTEWVRNVL